MVAMPESSAADPPPLESTHELVDRARSGDAAAVERLCARYLPRIRRWARARLPRRSRGLLETDDLAQEVLLRTVRHVDSISSPGLAGFHAYLRRVLENRVRDEVRRVDLHPEQTDLDSAHEDSRLSPLEALLGREESARYESALAELSETDREAVMMRIELRAGYDEIAEALGKGSANTARMTVVRALERLVEKMSRGGLDDA